MATLAKKSAAATAPAPSGLQLVSFDGHQVAAEMAVRLLELDDAARIAGRYLSVTSGYRSREQQQSLYDRWLAGELDAPSVARPGTSKHETGRAVDMKAPLLPTDSKGYDWLAANAPAVGLKTVRGEPWHWELP